MEANNTNNLIKILWMVCVIPLIAGIIMIISASTKETYSTDEYWVAQGYHHVYERYSGEIVDMISDNETCEIKGNTIIVTTTNQSLHRWGGESFLFCVNLKMW